MLTPQAILGIKWGVLLITAFIYIYWLMRQDAFLTHGAARNPPISHRTLIKCIQSRSLQISVLLILCLVLFAVLDIQHYNGRKIAAVPAAARNAAVPPAPVVPPAAAVGELDAALTNANQKEAMEDRLDALKESYEGGFVSYYYLRRCGMARPEDIFTIREGLIAALLKLGAEEPLAGSMAESIESASKGSYVELYSASACDQRTLSTMQEQYTRYLQGLNSVSGTPSVNAR